MISRMKRITGHPASSPPPTPSSPGPEPSKLGVDQDNQHSNSGIQNSSSRNGEENSTMGKELSDENLKSYPPDEDSFPDGGLRAWIIVFGAMFSSFSTFGFVNSWGVFQAYYQETLLNDLSPSTISWIGSIQYSLIFFPGLIIGRLFDIGYFRLLYTSCSVLLVLATFLTGQCTQYWQFLLCQGIVIGTTSGGIYSCSNSVIAHWFRKKRGRAMGYMAIGSALSGATIPIAIKNLIPAVGFPWTMRILGFILAVAIGISNLTVKTRLQPINVKGGLFNLAVFKSPAYTILCLSALFVFLGFYTVLTYVGVSARELGSSADLAFYFVAISNGSSLFGRWSAGIFSDMAGPLNVMIPSAFIAGILTYVWPFTRSTASLIVVTVIYGFCCGAYVAILTNPVMNLGQEGDVGRRVGMYLTIMAVGALAGPPISGAINTSTGGFSFVGIYAGSAVMVGVMCLVMVRYLVLGCRWVGKA